MAALSLALPLTLPLAPSRPLTLAARDLALDYFFEHPPERLAWSWRSAILLHGSVTLGARIGDAALLDSVTAFMQNKAHARVSIRRSDAAACALPALALYEATGERAGLPLVERAAKYLQNAPTSADGAIYHLGTELWARPLPASIWADSLMMVGVLEARLARYYASDEWRARALRTTLAIARALRDEHTGLFLHAVIPSLSISLPTARAFWVRGNGWMLTAAASIADALALDATERATFSGLFSPAAETLAKYMHPDGALPNLIWEHEYEDARASAKSRACRAIESSGTALCAAGILDLARLGIVPPSLIPRAHDAARAASTCITPNARGRSELTHTSGPTSAGPAFHYALVPNAKNADYGVGAIALAATAASFATSANSPPI